MGLTLTEELDDEVAIGIKCLEAGNNAVFGWFFDQPHIGNGAIPQVHIEFGVEHIEPGPCLQPILRLSGMDLATVPATNKYHDDQIAIANPFKNQYYLH